MKETGWCGRFREQRGVPGEGTGHTPWDPGLWPGEAPEHAQVPCNIYEVVCPPLRGAMGKTPLTCSHHGMQLNRYNR